MCGRYSITTPVQAMADLFGFGGPFPNLAPRYNVAPTQGVPVVRVTEHGPDKGGRELAFVRWGLVPGWAKEVASKPLINARGETVAEKNAFRAPFLRRRCLVPADGFYEWRRREGEKPQPVHIHAPGGGMLCFGGIWEAWLGADGSEIDSMAIVTTAANETLSAIHHRMPVLLTRQTQDIWLHGEVPEALALIGPAPEDALTYYPVSTAVNRVCEDHAGLIAQSAPERGPSQPGGEDLPQSDQLSLF